MCVASPEIDVIKQRELHLPSILIVPYLSNPDSLWSPSLTIFRRDVIATEVALERRSSDEATIEAASALPAGDSVSVLISIAARADKGRADLRRLILWYFDIDRRTSQRSLVYCSLRLCTELRHDHRIPTVVNRASIFHSSIVPVFR